MSVKQRLSVYLDADMMARLENLAAKERARRNHRSPRRRSFPS
jgi:hypothetical protein